MIGTLAGIGALAALALPATAADKSEDELIHEGVDSRRTNDDLKALELFRQAYDLHHHPRPAAQMGLAEVALGRWIDAEAHLAEAVGARSDPWISKNSTTLRKSLAQVREHIGALEVLGGPAGAEIVIEGAVVGKLPLANPIHVRAGECRFNLTAPNYEPETRTVRIVAGALVRETVNLSRAVVPTSPPALSQAGVAAAPGAPPVVGGAPPQAAQVPAEAIVSDTRGSEAPGRGDEDTRGGSGARLAGIILGGAGVAALGAGVWFGLTAQATGNRASNKAVFDPSLDSSGRRYQTLQWVGYGLGGALLAAGVTTYIIGNRAEQRETKVSFFPAKDGGIAVLDVRF